MKVTIFGAGYVGLVTAACLAEVGNSVLCVDINADRVARLQNGECPIYEPGLEQILKDAIRQGHLRFTTDIAEAVAHGQCHFIAVGTPPQEDGSVDRQHVLAVAKSIGEHLQAYTVVVDKSTVPVGTADLVRDTILHHLRARGINMPFDVVSNPEFLKEGAAVNDFKSPDRIVIGSNSGRATELLTELYAPFNRNHDRLIVMDVRSAELTKYAANAMLATKISFINEMSHLAERLGADIEQVRKGIGADKRIGHHFIYPGCGYGGSCFPKDVLGLINTGREINYVPQIIQAVDAVNQKQKQVLFQKLHQHFEGNLAGKTIALWGLAFKPNTDDIREASSRVLMEALWKAGACVRAYDPAAMNNVRAHYGNRADLTLCKTANEALKDADALVVVTEWPEFRSPDFTEIKEILNEPVIVDGRNLYKLRVMREYGFCYYSIGRPVVMPVMSDAAVF